MGGPDNAGMGAAAEIEQIVKGLVDKEPESFTWEAPWSHGTIQHSDRVLEVAKYAVKHYPGDLAEIGCMTGATTKSLAALAAAHKRRVIAIDPWEPGTQNCDGTEYETFLENTAPYKRIVNVLRMRSQLDEASDYLRARALCFAFVDGSHEYEDCFWDIMATSHAPIICVDDVLWNSAVRLAFEHGAGDLDREVVTNRWAKEGYLIG